MSSDVEAAVVDPMPSMPLSRAGYVATCLLLALIAGGIDWWRWAWQGDMVYSAMYIVGVLHYIVTIGLLLRFVAPGGEQQCGAPNVSIFPANLVIILVASFVLIHAVGLVIGVFTSDVEAMSHTWPSFWTYSTGSLVALLAAAFPLGTIILLATVEC